MLFDSPPAQFHFGQHIRHALFWENPNYAGAFIATALPLIWGFEHLVEGVTSVRRTAQYGLYGVEAVGYLLLAETYSRGAMVSLILSLLFFISLVRINGSRVIECKGILTRAIALLGIVCITGFSERMAIGYAVTDRSILNRVTLYAGATRMIIASPIAGWGYQCSGEQYVNWFEPLSHVERFQSIINSYLTIAVEWGLITFCIPLFSLCYLLCIGCGKDNRVSSWTPLFSACKCTWFSWALVNLFSNLYVVTTLWIIPAFATVIIARQKAPNHRMQFIVPLIVVAIASALLVGVGEWSKHLETISVTKKQDGSVRIEQGKGIYASAVVLLDSRVTGIYPGIGLRVWFKESRYHSLSVYDNTSPFSSGRDLSGEVVVGFGFRCSEIIDRLNVIRCKCLLVHPLGDPPARTPKITFHDQKVILVLPGVDDTGNRVDWIRWASSRGIAVTYDVEHATLLGKEVAPVLQRFL